MPRKKTSPAKRREQEKKRRLAAIQDKKSGRPDTGAQAAKTDEITTQAQARKPEPAPARTRPARNPKQAAAYVARTMQSIRLTDAGDAGNECRHYTCELPRHADLKILFDAIRDSRPRHESGTVYIKIGTLPTNDPLKSMSYTYQSGVFTRAEQFTKAMQDKMPVMADLLGEPVLDVKATGGWGRMDYFVTLPDHDIPSLELDPDPQPMPIPGTPE